MPQFDFYQDTRIRTWERCHFKVEAESYEAAVAIIKNFCDCDVNNHEEEVEFGPLEILFEPFRKDRSREERRESYDQDLRRGRYSDYRQRTFRNGYIRCCKRNEDNRQAG